MISNLPIQSDLLLQPRYCRLIAESLIQELADAGMQPEDLAADPFGTIHSRGDLSIEETALLDPGCQIAAHYDERTSPPTIHVKRSFSQGRNNFSILHELAHHAQACSEQWAELFYEIPDRARRSSLKELVADRVAALILLDDELMETSIGGSSGVTALGVRNMYLSSEASMTACLVRALDAPGERVVLLGTPDGRLYFSAHNSDELRSPSTKQPQANLRDAYEKLLHSQSESTAVHGGHGLEYLRARSNTNVIFDVALCEGSLLAVVTKGHDQRHSYGDKEPYTGSICGHEFDVAESSGDCQDCGELKCAECSLCGCESKKPRICTSCSCALYATDIAQGRSEHEECW